jgi:hypothetical protein
MKYNPQMSWEYNMAQSLTERQAKSLKLVCITEGFEKREAELLAKFAKEYPRHCIVSDPISKTISMFHDENESRIVRRRRRTLPTAK